MSKAPSKQSRRPPQAEEALRVGKLQLMLIERLAGDVALAVSTLLMVLGLRSEAIAVGTASFVLAARSRRP